MKRTIILAAVLTLTAACAHTAAPATESEPVTIASSGPGELGAETTTIHLTAAPKVEQNTPPETASIDPLARLFTSAKYVTDAQKSIQIAGPQDVIFTTCVQTTLNVGVSLREHPIVNMPALDLGSADPSCPLCLLAMKRKIADDLLTGDVAKHRAEILARVRDVETKLTIGCAALFADEKFTLAKLVAAFGGGRVLP